MFVKWVYNCVPPLAETQPKTHSSKIRAGAYSLVTVRRWFKDSLRFAGARYCPLAGLRFLLVLPA